MTLLRTVKHGDAHLAGVDWIIVGAAMVLVPPFVGLLVWLVVGKLAPHNEAGTVAVMVMAFLVVQVMAPIVTFFAAIPALVLGCWALRLGWAGWGMAIVVPAVLICAVMYVYSMTQTGYTQRTYLEPAVIFAASGALHGLVMWLALRLRRPAAVAPR